MEGKSRNPFVNFANWLVDLLNSWFPPRDSEVLLTETIESGNSNFRRSIEAIKASNGDIEVMVVELGKQKSAAATARSNVQQAVAESQRLDGVRLQASKRNIAALQAIANSADQVVAEMEQTIAAIKATQEMGEAGLVISESERRLRESQLRGDVALERLYKTMERANDAQLRAAGFLSDPKIKDHSAEIKRRSATARGRYQAGKRVTDSMIGTKIAAPLSAAEEDLLSQAYQASGVQKPQTEDDKTNQAAS